ncbi:MAG: hypothetical protein EZS28_041576 [Streblomastix strix]|uniref:Uncharacterized protein n=1 Tax=Streblomastix strix TaxID=222440 RepID=A0A5J4TXA5_9EUKA|nr:MAG: hypothetical protein EZS28_041576 [Streblomastix strix]
MTIRLSQAKQKEMEQDQSIIVEKATAYSYIAVQIRRDECDYIIQNRQTYQAGFDSEIESLEKYIQKMRQQGYYGDGRLFPAICALYRVRVRVLMPGGIVFKDGDPTYPVIELVYIGHIHYVSIQSV